MVIIPGQFIRVAVYQTTQRRVLVIDESEERGRNDLWYTRGSFPALAWSN
jgi:hypothetical protein